MAYMLLYDMVYACFFAFLEKCHSVSRRHSHRKITSFSLYNRYGYF